MTQVLSGDYKGFKARVTSLLKRYKHGLTWTEIRQKGKFPQTVPNNRWVKKLEKEIGLKRVDDARGRLWMLR